MIRPSHAQIASFLAMLLVLVVFTGQVKMIYEPLSARQLDSHRQSGNSSSSNALRFDLENSTNHDIITLNDIIPSSSHELDKCSSEADSPLRDIHMVMIGDSLMRYQYLSLVYRLRHGVWFDDSKWYYHLVNEKTFGDPYHNHTWGAFLFHTNRILHPNEVCDCHRKAVYKMEEIVENRYYYDPILNNSVVYLLAYGHAFPVVGRLAPRQVRQQARGWQMKAFREYSGTSWQYHDWSDVIRNHVQYLDPQPRHVVMNAGAWKHKFGWTPPGAAATSSSNGNMTTTGTYSKHATNLFQVMKELPQYEYVWRTTTHSKHRGNDGYKSDSIMCERFSTCINVSFTRQIRQDLYWDKLHFVEPVYRAVNEEMLNVLGYLPNDYIRMNRSDLEG